ncbi:MAG: response regulator [Chloroflexi bacterium]|nr:response regulator [Chloroflexota bacterium]
MAKARDKEARRKILLVDDEAPLRMLMAATLDGSGYQLFEATNGEEGLEVALREKPDLILLDVAMPKMNGFEVCRRIKSDPTTKDTVVIMLTAMSQQSDYNQGKETGADAYFTKPFSPIALLNKIKEVLASQQG